MPACGHCHARDVHLSLCSGCKDTWYCGRACQKAHYKTHKAECRSKQAEARRTDTGAALSTGKQRGKAKVKAKGNKKTASTPPTTNRSTSAVDPDVSFGANDDCPVCLSELVNPRRLPNCGHYLCLACLNQLRKYSAMQETSCPTCRGPLPEGSPEKTFEEALGREAMLERKMEARGLSGREGDAAPNDLKAEVEVMVAQVHEAAEGGLAGAQFYLGFFFETGPFGMQQDHVSLHPEQRLRCTSRAWQ